ncbi:peptidyl-tRNA hydrolase II [Gonapodya prolifera JEL478]|uniref:peptidyl-tRNA hydrolase n=1 Tax=Gonapodya prolifera (strain JEL478) TaxID=1344416 RepID=A0A139ALS9_GONPJ|nr:peptidyl-tRNA hydrolase II [Gonapodya prolifera JEL478]|eukprot:KXS17720.1 peptidyl-tRNA hydrolase II [Gonapodya prolifera JEL478]
MWIVLRKDLVKSKGWNTGSVIAQACHASTTALWLNREDPVVQEYMRDAESGSTHKVVLEVKDATHLSKLASNLDTLGIRYHTWTEQPENIPTCIATLPHRKSQVGDVFRKGGSLYR